MFKPTEDQPATVPVVATQAGKIQDRWPWVAPEVWTERMLTALEQGVKGGVWFSLMDKVFSRRTLEAAAQQVVGNKGAAGVDHVTVDQFSDELTTNLDRLHDGLRCGTYVPQAIRRHWIPKPGSTEMRPLGIPTVRDRVVQTALRRVLEPIFERDFAAHSYGFRPGRGCKDALRRVQELLKAGYVYVVDADLKSYFDTISHDRLMDLLCRRVADGRVLALVETFLKQGVLDGLSEWTPEQGTPQGAVISPLLANIYLNPLDHHMAERGYAMVRYADDFVILCRSAQEAERALAEVRVWVASAGLQLHPSKTKLVHAEQEGFDFLGYHFQGSHKRWPRMKSRNKLYDAIRGKTRRTDGRSLAVVIADVSRTLVGWFGYFKHSRLRSLTTIDSWVRMRLRSILRRRAGRRGCGRGEDHHRWPNAFFTKQGLFSLAAAHALACQSPRG